MGSQEKTLLLEKLTRLAEYIDELAPYVKLSYTRHAQSKGNQRVVENDARW